MAEESIGLTFIARQLERVIADQHGTRRSARADRDRAAARWHLHRAADRGERIARAIARLQSALHETGNDRAMTSLEMLLAATVFFFICGLVLSFRL